MKTVELPRWVFLCLIIATAASLVSATVSTLTSVTVRRPLSINIIVQDPTLRLDSAVPEYNATLNIYTKFTLGITNIEGGSINAKITINLYDSAQARIAYGESTVSIPTSTATVAIPLVWTTGKNLTNLVSGKIIIEQTA